MLTIASKILKKFCSGLALKVLHGEKSNSMNIVVCVKQIPDPAMALTLDDSTKCLVRDDKLIMDDSDSYGVEMALQLAEQAGGGEVKGPCLEFALVTNQESGVWGGTAEEERRQLRKIWLSRQAGQEQINQMSKLRLSNRKPIHGQEQLNGSRRRRLG